MKRNWYAIAILVLLAAVLLGCKQYEIGRAHV